MRGHTTVCLNILEQNRALITLHTRLSITRYGDADLEEIMQGLTRDLKALGLSAVEARIVVALLSLKKATASEIARVAKLARSEVYRKLPNLAALGLVRKITGPPDSYQAYDVAEIIERLYDEHAIAQRQRLQAMKQMKQKIVNQAKMLPAIHEHEISKPRRIIISNKQKL